MSLYIFDIDGTLTKYIHDDAELKENPDAMRDALSKLEPFPWAKNIIEKARKSGGTICFITGRQHDEVGLTKKWIYSKLGLKDFIIHFVPYRTKELYIMEKIDKIFEMVFEICQNICNETDKIIVYDDDLDVLESLLKRKEIFSKKFEIYAVKDGRPVRY